MPEAPTPEPPTPQRPAPDPDLVGLPLDSAVLLSEFLAGLPAPMTVAERRLVVQQAIGMLENAYVHLPVKQYLYGIDPIGRLRELQEQLGPDSRLDSLAPADDLPFHRHMVAILTQCRDMHTGYYLPRPFDRSIAFLPFQIEECYDGATRSYIVARVFPDSTELAGTPEFGRGVKIVAWNDDPIEHAVLREGDQSAGINTGARHARGLYRLTTRFLAKCPPPEGDDVRVTFVGDDGARRTVDLLWRVVQLDPGEPSLPEGVPIGEVPHHTLDFETEAYRAMKRDLSARYRGSDLPASVAQVILKQPDSEAFCEAATRIASDGKSYAYMRLRSFVVEDASQALAKFIELLDPLPREGLVIDVRDNPGGSIEASEMILQSLAARPLDRARLAFRNTKFIQRLCELRKDKYGRWQHGLERAGRTGAVFSGGVPLFEDESFREVPCVYPGPMVLIANALSYSATDFFAAGFQDHDLGPVLGLHRSTGGGGANVLTLQTLANEIAECRDGFTGMWVPIPLPRGAELHFAFRRSMRTARHAGLEVEDFGVVPDEVYLPSRRDALEGNPDLFDKAVSLLRRPPVTAAGH